MKQAFILLVLVMVPVSVVGDTIYVPDDQVTIQAAIDASADGDTVIVRPGTYVENINFNGKAITLQSEQGPEVTIIDGNDSGTVVHFNHAEGRDSVLDGFTLQNGFAEEGGGGISMYGASLPVIKNNIITGNDSDLGGGGMRCRQGASPLILNNTIEDNSAQWGGGIFCYDRASPDIRGNTISENHATVYGGGIFCELECSPHICGNTIDGNSSGEEGGGICCYDATPHINGNIILDNTGLGGGGILCWNSECVLINNTIKANTAVEFAGGISLTSDAAGPEMFPALVAGNAVVGNVAGTGAGGLHLRRSTAEVRNNLITGNTASAGYGGGIRLTSDTDVLVSNCTIAGNSAVLGGGAIGAILGAEVNIENCILWGNTAPTGKTLALADDSTLSISYCDVDGGEAAVDVEAGSTLDWGVENIDVNPLFESLGDDDYFLAASSQCIDAGDVASRVIGGTTTVGLAKDAGILDMGFHYPGLAYLLTGPGPAIENPPMIRLFQPECDGEPVGEWNAYGATGYGVNVTAGDVNGDLHDEVITGAGPGDIYGPHVRGFDVSGTPISGLSFLAYGTNKYGVNVACGDIDADGFDEIVTGAGPGAVFGPHVRAWNYDGGPAVTPLSGVSYFAYGTPKWGVNVSCGDIDGDGYDEIVTGAGPGAVYGPHVRGWDVNGGTVAAMGNVSFLAYGTNKFGVNVACGDIDGDGIDEIITGAGPGEVFGSHVRGWNVDGGAVSPIANISFFAWSPDDLRYGANVFSGTDLNGNGRDEIVVGQGPDPNAGSEIKVYLYDGTQVIEWVSLKAYGDDSLTHGANVAAGHF